MNLGLSLLLMLCVQGQPDLLTHEDFQKLLKTTAGEQLESPRQFTVPAAGRAYIEGRYLAARDQHGTALAHFRRAAELHPQATAPWIGMAISLAAIGKQSAAMSAWHEVLLRDPNNNQALLIVGIDEARRGNHEASVKMLSRSWLDHEVMPEESLLRFAALNASATELSLVSLVNAIGDYEHAIVENAFGSLVQKGAGEMWRTVIQQLVDVRAYSTALDLTRKGILSSSNQLKGFLLTALPVLEAAAQGDGQITINTYNEAMESEGLPLGPKWHEPVSLAEGYSMAAQSMSMIGDRQGTINLYRASMSLFSEDAIVLNNLAWALLNTDGPTEEVEQLSLKAHELDAEAAYILDTLGWYYYQKGEMNKALEFLVRALRGSSQPSPELCEHMGDAYWQSGQVEPAIRAWSHGLSIIHSDDFKRNVIEGFATLNYSVWGIAVASPEKLYDLEMGSVHERLTEKLSKAQQTKSTE